MSTEMGKPITQREDRTFSTFQPAKTILHKPCQAGSSHAKQMIQEKWTQHTRMSATVQASRQISGALRRAGFAVSEAWLCFADWAGNDASIVFSRVLVGSLSRV